MTTVVAPAATQASKAVAMDGSASSMWAGCTVKHCPAPGQARTNSSWRRLASGRREPWSTTTSPTARDRPQRLDSRSRRDRAAGGSSRPEATGVASSAGADVLHELVAVLLQLAHAALHHVTDTDDAAQRPPSTTGTWRIRRSVIRFMIDSTSSVGVHTRTVGGHDRAPPSLPAARVWSSLSRCTMSRSDTMPVDLEPVRRDHQSADPVADQVGHHHHRRWRRPADGGHLESFAFEQVCDKHRNPLPTVLPIPDLPVPRRFTLPQDRGPSPAPSSRRPAGTEPPGPSCNEVDRKSTVRPRPGTRPP